MSSSWPKVQLGKVLTQIWRVKKNDPEKEYSLIGAHWYAGGLYIKDRKFGRDIQADRLYQIRSGDFVYNRLFAWKGSFALAGADVDGCYVSNEFPVFEINCKRLDGRFLYLNFKKEKTWTESLGLSVGATPTSRNRLKEALFLKMSIPLPPLAEQRRIVARIEELAAQVHEAQRLRREAAEEAEALHSRQLEFAMTPNRKGWKRETVADVILSMDAGWSPQCDDVPAGDNEWGVLKTTAVQWCEFHAQHNKALPPALSPIPELTVKEGDVLVTRAGPRKRVAVVAAVRCDEPRLTISDKLIRLRTDRTKIEPRFLELSLASPFSQEHLVQRKTGLADAQVNISQAILKATPVAYPQLPEQRRIVAELEALQTEIDTIKRLQAETTAELDALLPSILDRAFKGEI